MSEEEILHEKLEKARDENSEIFQNAPLGMSWEELRNYMKKSNHKVSLLSRKYRLIKTPKFSELSTYGDVMPMKEFKSACRCGGFINYDGFGLYVRDGQESDIEIYPSDVINRCVRKDFDTVIWFNR